MVLTRARVGTVFAAVLVAALTAATVSASNAIRPRPGTPDPKAMVLTRADLGNARVTAQGYFKDPDFPSVISYSREFEDGRVGATSLPYVESQAEVGRSAATTTRFLAALKAFFASKEGRALIVETLRDELGGEGLISNIRVSRPRNLGVGPHSFDAVVTASVLGQRIELHAAAFSVERILGLLSVAGDLGRRVPLSVMKRLARVMAARTALELVPRNTAPPTILGTPFIGQTLTANPGAWTGNPGGFTYRWERCDAAGSSCGAITSASGRTYVVAEADVGSTLRVAVSPRGANVGEAAVSPRTEIVAVFLDTFSGSDPGRWWSFTTNGTGPRIAQANGQLEMMLPIGTVLGPGAFANANALTRCRMPGDFDMQVDYTLLSGLLLTDKINVGFEAAEFTGDTWTGQHGLFVHHASTGLHGISTHFPDPGVYAPPYNDFVPDSSTSGTLRLVRTTRSGVTTITASRLTGPSWSFTSLPYTPPTSQAALLYVWTSVTPFTQEVRVAFDNFRVSSGAVTCP